MQRSVGASFVGDKSENEDSILMNDKLGLYVVADGVGGMPNAHLVSKMACKLVESSVKQGLSLEAAIHKSHESIQVSGLKASTTIAAVLIKDGKYDIAWIGSSRVYFWDGVLHQLTKDDSVEEFLASKGIIDFNVFGNGNYNKVLTQAVGINNHAITVHSNKGYLSPSQILLLSTDGFHQEVDEQQIVNMFDKHLELDLIGQKLFNLGTHGNPVDDMSYILVKSEENALNIESIVAPAVVRVFAPQ